MAAPKGSKVLVAGLAVVIGMLPIILYHLFLGSVPTVTPAEAKEMLADAEPAILLDVRAAEEFDANHLSGAVNWPFESINKTEPKVLAQQAEERFGGRKVLVICDSGVLSALAAQKLHSVLPATSLYNVRGGMAAWIAGADNPCGTGFCTIKTADGTTEGLPFRESSTFEQWMAVASGFWIKPTYMILSIVLIVVLWRQRSPDLLALRWGLIFFFLGEAFCAANYLIFHERSFLFEYLHSFGMVLSFGFITYAFFEGLDLRLIRYSDPDKRCAALGLCQSCAKYAEVPCGLQRVFLVLIPAHIVLAFMPLTGRPIAVSYNSEIWGTFYNYSHAAVYQLFEMRYCPVTAIMLFAASLGVLLFKRNNAVAWSKVLFACGMGPFAFGLLRFVLLTAYHENLLWFAAWEEITELMFIVGVIVVLWIFRDGLFEGAKPAES